VTGHYPRRSKLDSLGRLVEFAANILIFAEQPQPKRFPLPNVCTTQRRLIDPAVTIFESIFERPAMGIEVSGQRR
jgi:hypothetical protein